MPLLVGEAGVAWPDRTLFFQWHRGDRPEPDRGVRRAVAEVQAPSHRGTSGKPEDSARSSSSTWRPTPEKSTISPAEHSQIVERHARGLSRLVQGRVLDARLRSGPDRGRR